MRLPVDSSADFGLILLFLLGFTAEVSAKKASLCSTQNTGSGGDSHQNNYQSNGGCTTTCSGYAFGVVQYKSCWCTNIAPGSTTDLDSCNVPCPGYPSEKCGNEDEGLFGYIVLNAQPQGTAEPSGASTSSPSPSPLPSPTPDTNTVTAVVTSVAVSVQSQPPSVSVSVASVIVTPSSPSPEPVTTSSPLTSSTSTSTPTSTWSPTPSPSVQTVSGSIKTVIITPTRPSQATTTVTLPDSQPATTQNNGGFFSNRGAVAGVFTVVGLIGAAIIGAAAFLCWRRRKQGSEGSERLNSMEEDRNSIGPSTFMSRRTSELGLRTDLPRVGTSDEKTPTSMHMPTPGTTSRRASMPLTDQRLNPANLFHDNGSHLSVTSLQDNQDYSRPVLQVANPDRPGSSAIADD